MNRALLTTAWHASKDVGCHAELARGASSLTSASALRDYGVIERLDMPSTTQANHVWVSGLTIVPEPATYAVLFAAAMSVAV